MMFQLTVIDEDHMILSCEEALDPATMHRVQDAFDKWKNDGGGLLIASQCRVWDQRVPITVDLDLRTFYDGAELNGGDGP